MQLERVDSQPGPGTMRRAVGRESEGQITFKVVRQARHSGDAVGHSLSEELGGGEGGGAVCHHSANFSPPRNHPSPEA